MSTAGWCYGRYRQVIGRSYRAAVDEGPIDGAAPGFRSALSHREFRWFVTHHLLAGTGQSLGTVAVAAALLRPDGLGHLGRAGRGG